MKNFLRLSHLYRNEANIGLDEDWQATLPVSRDNTCLLGTNYFLNELHTYFYSFMTFTRQDKESGLAGHIDHNAPSHSCINKDSVNNYQFFI